MFLKERKIKPDVFKKVKSNMIFSELKIEPDFFETGRSHLIFCVIVAYDHYPSAGLWVAIANKLSLGPQLITHHHIICCNYLYHFSHWGLPWIRYRYWIHWKSVYNHWWTKLHKLEFIANYCKVSIRLLIDGFPCALNS